MNAAGDTSMQIRYAEDPDCLHLCGCHVDRVRNTKRVIDDDDYLGALREGFSVRTNHPGPYSTGELSPRSRRAHKRWFLAVITRESFRSSLQAIDRKDRLFV